MVRLKNRYLLVHILYPDSATASSHGEAPSTLFSASRATLLHTHAPTPDSVTAQTLARVLRAQVAHLFGDAGLAAVSPSLAVKYWSNATSTFIVRCARAAVKLLWAACTFVRELPLEARPRTRVGSGEKMSEEVVLQVLRVSGTVRKCEEEAIRRAKALCGRAMGPAPPAAGLLDGDLNSKRVGGNEAELLDIQSEEEDLGEVVTDGGLSADDLDDETSDEKTG